MKRVFESVQYFVMSRSIARLIFSITGPRLWRWPGDAQLAGYRDYDTGGSFRLQGEGVPISRIGDFERESRNAADRRITFLDMAKERKLVASDGFDIERVCLFKLDQGCSNLRRIAGDFNLAGRVLFRFLIIGRLRLKAEACEQNDRKAGQGCFDWLLHGRDYDRSGSGKSRHFGMEVSDDLSRSGCNQAARSQMDRCRGRGRYTARRSYFSGDSMFVAGKDAAVSATNCFARLRPQASISRSELAAISGGMTH